MSKHWKYLWYMLRHKFFVLQEGRKIGVPLWRLLIHDWSKFLPSEWFPYAELFYGPVKNQRLAQKIRDLADDSLDVPAVVIHSVAEMIIDQHVAGVLNNWNIAWLKHVHRQPHHWNHWVAVTEDGPVVYDMPKVLVLEMIADWRGAGLAKGRPCAILLAWYEPRKHKINMSPRTRQLVEQLLYSPEPSI